MAQLYSVRSRASWGIGDFADLADLAWGSGQAGADFLLVNPLAAAEPVPPLTPSPYLPTSRRFVHPLYIRPEDIPEAAYLPIAEEHGLLARIDRWAVAHAIALVGERLRANKRTQLLLSVSHEAVLDPGMPGFVGEQLANAGVPGEPGRALVVEGTHQ